MLPLVRLSLQHTQVTASAQDIAAAASTFAREFVVRLPALLDVGLLKYVQTQIEQDGFRLRVHENLPTRPSDLVLNPSLALGSLLLAANDPQFLNLLRTLTAIEEAHSISGTIQRRIPGAGHHDAWHDDASDGRLAVLSVNLSTERYAGGELQIREGADGPIVASVANTVPGDAILFKIHGSLKHRVTPLEGTTPRTVFAGWLRRESSRKVLGLVDSES